MTPNWSELLGDRHGVIFGGTRTGKSFLLVLIVMALLKRGLDGITAIDPHGSFVRRVIECLANPDHRLSWRTTIILDPASGYTWGLNPLAAVNPDRWEDCHDASNTLVDVVQNRFEASPEQTPRLARILYCGGVLIAHKGLTVLELLELLSLGADELRRSLLQNFENRVIRPELLDLQLLASKQPARFLELVESLKNRLIRWLGDPRLARILGQKRGLDLLACMDQRAIVLADYSSLSYEDAAFLGCIHNTMLFNAARKREPMRAAPHRLVLDEAESLLVLSSARMCDQTAKYGLFLYAAIQRLGQLRARGDFLLDALMENCLFKASFAVREPASARYIAELFNTGHVDLESWVPSSARPTAVGNEKRVVHSVSVAEHEAEHQTYARTVSHAAGEALGTMSGTSTAVGAFSGSGESAGLVLSPPTQLLGPSAPHASMMQYPLSESSGQSSSSGSSHQSATTTAESHSTFEMHGEAETVGTGSSRGRSETHGESEVFTTVYETLPSQRFSLEEQQHRLAGELMTLPRRELFIKVDGDRPVRTRTADVKPEFASAKFRNAIVPSFRGAVEKRCSALAPVAEIDAQIAARRASLKSPTPPLGEPDLSPSPLPVVDAPFEYGRAFWAARNQPNDTPRKPKPKKSLRGRRPVGDRLDDRHNRFSIIDGEGVDNDPTNKR